MLEKVAYIVYIRATAAARNFDWEWRQNGKTLCR